MLVISNIHEKERKYLKELSRTKKKEMKKKKATKFNN